MAAILGGIGVAPAQAATSSPSTSSCSPPAVFQPFLPWGDRNWYAMVPGEALDNFAGTGWVLSGGAKITTQTLANGKTGLVLDMPSGSKAVSPEMCIGDGYPIANANPLRQRQLRQRRVHPLRPHHQHPTGDDATARQRQMVTDTASQRLPGAIQGWHIMQYTYVAGGQNSDFQIYDFGVDPRMRC